MLEFLKAGGPVMVLLVMTSLVALTFIIERGLALRWKKIIPPEVSDLLDNCHSQEELDRLQALCQEHPSPISRLLQVAMSHFNWTKSENIDAIQTRARKEIIQMERGLVFLEISVGIAPLLGLVGAVHGLITLFGDFSVAGINDNATLAEGIAIALHTTLVGLLIAIPALIAWSYYSKKVESIAVEMEALCDAFLRRFYNQE